MQNYDLLNNIESNRTHFLFFLYFLKALISLTFFHLLNSEEIKNSVLQFQFTIKPFWRPINTMNVLLFYFIKSLVSTKKVDHPSLCREL